MKNRIFWEEFKSNIEEELVNIDEFGKELKMVPGKPARISRRTKGSILHDFYNCCERIFKHIAADINGGFGPQERWHKELLSRMTIKVNKIRPAVISKELAAELDDYLSFRHTFRNIYGFELNGERLDRLLAKFDKTAKKFKGEIKEFIQKIEGK